MDYKKYLKIIGKKGGNATKKKHSKNYYKKIGRLGNEARWGEKRKRK